MKNRRSELAGIYSYHGLSEVFVPSLQLQPSGNEGSKEKF